MDPTCELQRLYESGIQFTVQPDAGCGFLVGYGDYLHRAENTAVLPTFERAVRWLMERVDAPVPDRGVGRSTLASTAGSLADISSPVQNPEGASAGWSQAATALTCTPFSKVLASTVG